MAIGRQRAAATAAHSETVRPGTQQSAVQHLDESGHDWSTAHGTCVLPGSGRRAAQPGTELRGRAAAGATRAMTKP